MRLPPVHISGNIPKNMPVLPEYVSELFNYFCRSDRVTPEGHHTLPFSLLLTVKNYIEKNENIFLIDLYFWWLQFLTCIKIVSNICLIIFYFLTVYNILPDCLICSLANPNEFVCRNQNLWCIMIDFLQNHAKLTRSRVRNLADMVNIPIVHHLYEYVILFLPVVYTVYAKDTVSWDFLKISSTPSSWLYRDSIGIGFYRTSYRGLT